jgi:hypothetical protein
MSRPLAILFITTACSSGTESEPVASATEPVVTHFCPLDTASRSSGTSPPCCYGSNQCFVLREDGRSINEYQCTLLYSPALCRLGQLTTFDTISDRYATRDCACVAIKPSHVVRRNDQPKPCNVSSTFGDAGDHPDSARMVCGRPNRGWRAFLQRDLSAFSGAYSCGIDITFPSASSTVCGI